MRSALLTSLVVIGLAAACAPARAAGSDDQVQEAAAQEPCSHIGRAGPVEYELCGRLGMGPEGWFAHTDSGRKRIAVSTSAARRFERPLRENDRMRA